jgi:enoyl-[acyl-carrier-protein] reductase (NADH)
MVVAAFVAPFLLEATTRFVATAAGLPGVRLGVITAESADRVAPIL